MNGSVTAFDQLKQLSWFMPDTRQRATEIGLAGAVAEELTKANVHISIEGDTSDWRTVGQPVLAVGDHSRGLESLLILGALNVVGRNDVSVTAKPYALTGQIITALSETPHDHLIGLIPGNMARGRKGGDLGTRVHRTIFRRHLPDTEGIRAYNQASLDVAGNALSNYGRVVTFFPTGGVYNAATTHWRTGVGHVAAHIPDDVFESTLVAPFMFSGINPRRILQAVASRRLGLSVKEQTVSIRFGDTKSLAEIFGGTRPDAVTITDTLYTRYRGEFFG